LTYVPITARQALEWAREDVEAQVSGANAHSERDEGLHEATAILDRWIRRVQDTKPKQVMRREADIHRVSRKDADL
jgi:hypothetical protein